MTYSNTSSFGGAGGGGAEDNKTQEKSLTADTTTIGVKSDLGFNNLVIGERYRYEINARARCNTAVTVQAKIEHDSVILGYLTFDGAATGQDTTLYASYEFDATATTVVFEVTFAAASGFFISGATTTFARLKEIHNEVVVTEFT